MRILYIVKSKADVCIPSVYTTVLEPKYLYVSGIAEAKRIWQYHRNRAYRRHVPNTHSHGRHHPFFFLRARFHIAHAILVVLCIIADVLLFFFFCCCCCWQGAKRTQ